MLGEGVDRIPERDQSQTAFSLGGSFTACSQSFADARIRDSTPKLYPAAFGYNLLETRMATISTRS